MTIIGTRCISFRGKCLNEEWVKGLLARKKNGYYISNSAGMPFAYEVRPKTLGQLSPWSDKDYSPIYEGDLVVDEFGRKSAVVFGRNGFELQFVGEKDTFVPAYEFIKKLKIIGTIHD